jgi:DNA invertase Pin-like site-specific DNA recombinase
MRETVDKPANAAAGKAFAYLRVSGKSQVLGDGFPRQLSEIESCAKSKGLEIARVFKEKGVCGDTDWEDRAAWGELVAALASTGVRVVIVESLNRLARELFIQEYIIRDLAKSKIMLLSAREQDIGSSPERILFRQIMGALSQYEKTMIVLKLRAAKRRKKALGLMLEGRKPFGFRTGERAVVDKIRALREAGLNCARIAEELNRLGLSPRKAKRWWPSSVQGVVSREETCGRKLALQTEEL